MESPRSITENTNVILDAPEGIRPTVVNFSVAPLEVVPAALPDVIPIAPVVLTVTSAPLGSKTTLFGAVMFAPLSVKDEEGVSIRNASLNALPTNSGNSSEKNFQFTAQCVEVGGTFRERVSWTRYLP